MAHAPEPDAVEVAHAVAMARLILPDDLSVQAPPNLSSTDTVLLIRAGINDFGGISPLTPDYINPEYPWPHLQELRASCAQAGFRLEPRLPVYDAFTARPGFVDEALAGPIAAARARLAPSFWGTSARPLGGD